MCDIIKFQLLMFIVFTLFMFDLYLLYVQNVEHLFWLLLNDKKQLKPTYEVHIEDVPEQPNL